VGLQEIFISNKNIAKFWIKIQNEYSSLAEEAVTHSFHFQKHFCVKMHFPQLPQ